MKEGGRDPWMSFAIRMTFVLVLAGIAFISGKTSMPPRKTAQQGCSTSTIAAIGPELSGEYLRHTPTSEHHFPNEAAVVGSIFLSDT